MSDNSGKEYLGTNVPGASAKRFLRRLKKERNAAEVHDWSKNRYERDGPDYHLTVVSPPELRGMESKLVDMFADVEISFVMKYNGSVRKGDAEAFYTIVSAPHADFLRQSAGLDKRDLHVTLGFDRADIHDLPKSDDTRITAARKARRSCPIYSGS